MDVITQAYNALNVFTSDQKLLQWLKANDPMALLQAQKAIERMKPLVDGENHEMAKK